MVPSPHKDFLLNSFPTANKVISVHTIEIKFLNCISQKITPRLQNVFVDYKMYSVPSPHKDFLLNNFCRIISREKLRGGRGGVINPVNLMITWIEQTTPTHIYIYTHIIKIKKHISA